VPAGVERHPAGELTERRAGGKEPTRCLLRVTPFAQHKADCTELRLDVCKVSAAATGIVQALQQGN